MPTQKRDWFISLADGVGGQESAEFFSDIRKVLNHTSLWTNKFDDGAVLDLGQTKLVLTTDSYTVDPIFFPGGDIGKLSVCGTINDLAVMGADVLGLSLSLVIEEGFKKDDLLRILTSINDICQQNKVSIVTGDTKVVEKGSLQGIIINTTGLGACERIIPEKGIKPGDVIMVSGSLGDHEIALLSQRFEYQTEIISDCAPLIKELKAVRADLTACKDPTRGGLASVLNEMSEKNQVKLAIEEAKIPFRKGTRALCRLMGLDPYFLASEGRLVATCWPERAKSVLSILRQFNSQAHIIGVAQEGEGVYLQTELGQRRLYPSIGKNVPRIC